MNTRLLRTIGANKYPEGLTKEREVAEDDAGVEVEEEDSDEDDDDDDEDEEVEDEDLDWDERGDTDGDEDDMVAVQPVFLGSGEIHVL
jgi:hypothetical protein